MADPDAPKLARGDYGRVFRQGTGWVWMVCTPSGHVGDLSHHEVVEHEDGTITASPSLQVSGRQTVRPRGEEPNPTWHGFLERGVWRSC